MSCSRSWAWTPPSIHSTASGGMEPLWLTGWVLNKCKSSDMDCRPRIIYGIMSRLRASKRPCGISLSWVPGNHLDSLFAHCLHVPHTGISRHHHSETVRAPLPSSIVFLFPCVIVYSPYCVNGTSTFLHVPPQFVAITTLISHLMSPF